MKRAAAHAAVVSGHCSSEAGDIREILLRRGFRLEGTPQASYPFELSRIILQHLPIYNALRKHFFSENTRKDKVPVISAPALTRALSERGWATSGVGGRLELRSVTPEVRKYLNGVWLEEYVWHALKKAGADEVMIGQKIFWTVDGVDGNNEIDVIARHGGRLTFVSCKTRGPFDSSGATDELSKNIYEVAYWKQHFLRDSDNAVLAITFDMIDEQDNCRDRVPLVRARGSILGVEVWGYEHLLSMLLHNA